MAVTQIDLDDEALAAVMRLAGVRTKKDAVNYALREIVERERRRVAWTRLRESFDEEQYETWKELRAKDKAAVGEPVSD
ncbi:type II toxin-antitoxin system VapB family antitoxin [Nocardioides sp.]|uniref:type II toxin-antitoxin system VapB family antitoxin n=1 Tax=Nocardioides sp. TaxID=35761 RepID=UPI0039E46C88